MFLMLLEDFHLRDAAVCFSGTHNVREQFPFTAMLLKGEIRAKLMKTRILNI